MWCCAWQRNSTFKPVFQQKWSTWSKPISHMVRVETSVAALHCQQISGFNFRLRRNRMNNKHDSSQSRLWTIQYGVCAKLFGIYSFIFLVIAQRTLSASLWMKKNQKQRCYSHYLIIITLQSGLWKEKYSGFAEDVTTWRLLGNRG